MARFRSLQMLSLASTFLFTALTAGAQCPVPEHGAIVANANRPTVADPADITQFGVLEVEYGYEHPNVGPGGQQNNFGGLLKFAVTCNLELRWDMATLLNQRNNGISTTGTGDNWLGFQYRFHRQTRRTPVLAFGYALKFPSASEAKGLGSGRYDHQAKVLVSKDLGGVHFDFNASLFIVGRQGLSGFDHNTELNLAFSHPVYKNLLFTGEFYGDTKLNSSTPAFASALWAFTYAVTPRLIIDAGVDHALTAAAPNRQRYFTGFTYSIKNLYSKR